MYLILIQNKWPNCFRFYVAKIATHYFLQFLLEDLYLINVNKNDDSFNFDYIWYKVTVISQNI